MRNVIFCFMLVPNGAKTVHPLCVSPLSLFLFSFFFFVILLYLFLNCDIFLLWSVFFLLYSL